MSINLYILLWLVSYAGLFYLSRHSDNDNDNQVTNVYWLTPALVLTLIWYMSPLSYIDLNLNGMMTGSNGFVNLLGYI